MTAFRAMQCEMSAYDAQQKCPVSSLHQLMASLCSCKRLIEIGNFIVDMIEAYGEAHIARRDAECGQLHAWPWLGFGFRRKRRMVNTTMGLITAHYNALASP